MGTTGEGSSPSTVVVVVRARKHSKRRFAVLARNKDCLCTSPRADHERPFSFLGTGMYGLLNGTAGRFQTGVVAIRLLS